MSEKNNWLREYLQGIDSKVTDTQNTVKSIQDTQNSLIKDTQRNWDSNKELYGDLEDHKTGKCNTIILHESNEHKGLAGKILTYILGMLTILGIIAGALWWLFTELRK